MSEFYGDAVCDTEPLIGGLIKMGVVYPNGAGPGSRRSFLVPKLNLCVHENKEISDGHTVYVSPPSVVYDLSGTAVADFQKLADAKTEFYAACEKYRAAIATFHETRTGKWLENELVPAKQANGVYPLFRSLDAAELHLYAQDCAALQTSGHADYEIYKGRRFPTVKIRGVSETDNIRYLEACKCALNK